MHEYAVVQALLDQCEMHAKAQKAKKILRVEVKIGVLSGVEPHLLKIAFDTFKADTLCEDAKLTMQIQPVVIHCSECEKTHTLAEHDYSCPECGANTVRVVDGEEMLLMRLEME
ncbi:hydrogenase maturation nickel metallochaperone HypA [Hydrogenimonas sp.]